MSNNWHDASGNVIRLPSGSSAFVKSRQSEGKQFSDQNGTVHAYSLDLLGRRTQDAVTTLGTGVDGTVRRIGATYEVRGMLQNVTSYSSPMIGQGTVANDVQRNYNSFQQPVTEYQDHSGAVNTSTSLNVQYQYASGSSNTVRPTAVVYPNGRVLNLNYGTSGGTDDALSRISSLIDSDGVTHLADYTRLGAASIVQVGYAQPGINYSLINGTGADPYTGLDQFDRVVDCRWYATANNTDVARIQHAYDLASNRLWRRDTVAETQSVSQDELYNYDRLYRLSEMQRGQLNSTQTGIVSGTLNFAQAWGLDATGNWGQFWEDDTGTSWNLQQTRTASLFNEITGITGGGWVVPAYDAAGNMTTMPQPGSPTSGYAATYDAWNRLMSLSSGGIAVAGYVYDGANRRVTKAVSGTTRHYYYSGGWQSLEERLGNSTSYDRQFVWGLRYIDDLVLRDSPDFTPNRLFALQDPNFNVIGVCDTTGTIQERYRYSAFGQPAFLTSGFAGRASSSYAWETLYAGYRWDVGTGLYQVRHRMLQPVLGCWLTRDPVAYLALRSVYAYAASRPVNFVDPLGLAVRITSIPQWRPDAETSQPKNQGDWTYTQHTFDEVAGVATFARRVLNAVQDIIGDCATLTLENKTVIQIDRNLITTSATIGYTDEKPKCTCDKCWQYLKKALDSDADIEVHYTPGHVAAVGPGAKSDKIVALLGFKWVKNPLVRGGLPRGHVA